MKLGRPKKHQIRYADDDWYRIVTKSPLCKDTVTFLERQIKRNDNSEKKLIQPTEQSTELVTDVPMSEIFKFNGGKWQSIGFRCNECNKTLSDENVISKHKFFCPRINTLSKEIDMPVQQVKVDGKVMYRWGDQGKAYPTREQAEAQGRAAYAAGYKGKQEKK